jgi:hypothetical protein
VDQQSAGKNIRRAKVKKGNRYLAGVLGETAVSAGRTRTRTRTAPVTGGWPGGAGKPRRRSRSATPS